MPDSCHCPNYKSVFFQILHHASVSWNTTPLYFFRLNVVYFAQKEPIKVSSGQNLPNSCETVDQFLFKFWITVLCHETELLYTFLAEILYIYFQQKEPIRLQILWNLVWAGESLKFCTLMGSFFPNHKKFQLKKYRRVISHDLEKWCKI